MLLSSKNSTLGTSACFSGNSRPTRPRFCLVIFFFRWTPCVFQVILLVSYAFQAKRKPRPTKRTGPNKSQLYTRLRRRRKRDRHDGLYDVHGAVLLPPAPAPPCRYVAPQFRRELVPAAAGGKHIEHGLQRPAGIGRRAAAPRTRGNIGLELLPLGVGELAGHGLSLDSV